MESDLAPKLACGHEHRCLVRYDGGYHCTHCWDPGDATRGSEPSLPVQNLITQDVTGEDSYLTTDDVMTQSLRHEPAAVSTDWKATAERYYMLHEQAEGRLQPSCSCIPGPGPRGSRPDRSYCPTCSKPLFCEKHGSNYVEKVCGPEPCQQGRFATSLTECVTCGRELRCDHDREPVSASKARREGALKPNTQGIMAANFCKMCGAHGGMHYGACRGFFAKRLPICTHDPSQACPTPSNEERTMPENTEQQLKDTRAASLYNAIQDARGDSVSPCDVCKPLVDKYDAANHALQVERDELRVGEQVEYEQRVYWRRRAEELSAEVKELRRLGDKLRTGALTGDFDMDDLAAWDEVRGA